MAVGPNSSPTTFNDSSPHPAEFAHRRLSGASFPFYLAVGGAAASNFAVRWRYADHERSADQKVDCAGSSVVGIPHFLRGGHLPAPILDSGKERCIMNAEPFRTSLLALLTTISIAVVFAELVGYLQHRLLHSDLIPSLSRGHLIHHLQLYRPNQPMRGPIYKNATEARASLGNIGMEWLAPIASVLLLTWGAMHLLRVPAFYQAIALLVMVLWPIFMFSYLHDRMHLENFWMARAPLLKNWFLRARRLHDIHHHSLNDEGRMDRNFGIGFFLFDRLLGTLTKRHRPLNRCGYRAALRRYNLHDDPDEEIPSIPSGFRV